MMFERIAPGSAFLAGEDEYRGLIDRFAAAARSDGPEGSASPWILRAGVESEF
jgi:hypothetical protein